MRIITFEWLYKRDKFHAEGLIERFVMNFGKQASVEKLVNWLHKHGKSDWEAWFLIQDPELTKLMIKNGAYVDADEGYALRVTAEYGNLQILEILLANGANPNFKNGTALHNAAFNGRLEVIKLLLKNGADVKNVYGAWALIRAADMGHREIVEVLLKNGADSNVEKGYALFLAASKGYKDIVETLLTNGADPNLKGSHSALVVAVRYGHLPTLRILVKHGADVHAEKDEAFKIAKENTFLRILEMCK